MAEFDDSTIPAVEQLVRLPDLQLADLFTGVTGPSSYATIDIWCMQIAGQRCDAFQFWPIRIDATMRYQKTKK
jgi:hypothetical protein